MDSHYSPPQLSDDPSGELGTLIHRLLELQQEGVTVCQRIRELHEQLSQSREATKDAASSEIALTGESLRAYTAGRADFAA